MNHAEHPSGSGNAVQQTDAITAIRVGTGIALTFVIAGGLIAAVTGPLQLAKGSWLAAYLVLVAGVALGVLARQPLNIDAPAPSAGRWWIMIGLWIAGNALVVAGALLSVPFATDLGGVVLVAVLVLALVATRFAKNVALAWVLRTAYVILIVSIPIGLALTHLRSG